MRNPDAGDLRYAFTIGYHHGRAYGPASPREAERALRYWNPNVRPMADYVDAFCNGSDDGHRRDYFRLVARIEKAVL